MSIKCGTCGGRHESIADVRACSEHFTPAPPVTMPQSSPAADERPRATERQVNFALSLFERRVLPEGKEPLPYDVLASLPRKGSGSIGEIIDTLLTFPEKPRKTDTKIDVPAGRYAIDTDAGLKFYVVDRPTEGRWAGWTFVRVQASDEEYPIKNRSLRDQILANIARDPQEAMLRYGREIGKCGHCGRTLTNEESRARGIGPICYGRMGWGSVSAEEMRDAVVPEWTLS